MPYESTVSKQTLSKGFGWHIIRFKDEVMCVVLLRVCAAESLWTSSFSFLAGSDHQQLLVIKLVLVALPESRGKGEDRESLCHLSMARDVKRSLGMSIIAQTEDDLQPAPSVQQKHLYSNATETELQLCFFMCEWNTRCADIRTSRHQGWIKHTAQLYCSPPTHTQLLSYYYY